MKIGIYPGTFDPVTLGHVDIIKMGLDICDRLIVAVAVNCAKKPLFSTEERIRMISDSCIGLDNVEVVSFEGLLSDYCRKRDIKIIIRGLRNGTDFDYELPMAFMNKRLTGGCATVFLVSDESHLILSSSMVREILINGGDVSTLIPKPALHLINLKTQTRI